MRKLIVSEFMSLDGVMQAPGGADEDTEGGFSQGGWTWPYWHDDIGAHFTRADQADADRIRGLGRRQSQREDRGHQGGQCAPAIQHGVIPPFGRARGACPRCDDPIVRWRAVA